MNQQSTATDPQRAARWAGYLSAIGAGGVGALTTGPAAGLEVYFDNLGINVELFASQPIDFIVDGDADLLLQNYVFGQGQYQGAFIPYFGGEFVGFRENGVGYASVLNEGDPINADTVGDGSGNALFQASLAYGAANPNAQWNDVTGGYLGLSFPDEAGAVTFYAWVRLSVNNANSTLFIEAAFASDNPNGIVAGQTSVPGDLNGNGSVEQGDLDLVLGNWGLDSRDTSQGGLGVPLGWFNDLPGDAVDQADLDIVLGNWGRSSADLPLPGVPEPGTLGLLAAGAAGVIARRRRA